MDFHPRLMAFDLDGTLAESKQRMSAEMGELLSKLLGRMPAAVMSGAGFHQFEKQFLPALPVEARLERLYLFPTNAAQCYVYTQDEWHPEYDHSFSAHEVERIHEALAEALKEVHLAEEPSNVWGERVEDRGAQITFSGAGQRAPLEEKQRWNQENNDKRKVLREALVKRLPDFSVGIGGLTSVDITRKGITKAYGILELRRLTGVMIEEMLYVGDALEEGGNDAVVIESGAKTHIVFGPGETAALIETILKHNPHHH